MLWTRGSALDHVFEMGGDSSAPYRFEANPEADAVHHVFATGIAKRAQPCQGAKR